MLKTPRMMEEEEKNKNFGEHYLTDNVRYCHLLIFLEKHQSRVYLLFYLAVEHYKMIMDFSLLKLKAKEIYDEYFAENSKFKLKLNHQIKKNIKQVLGKYSEITVTLFNQAQKESLNIIEKLFPEFIKSDIYQEMESLVKHKILVQRVVDTAEEKNTDISHLTFNQLKQMGHQVKEKYLEMEGDEKNVYIPKKTEKRKSRPVSFGVVVSLIKNESHKRGNKHEMEKSHTMRGLPTNSALITPQSEDNQKWNAYINKYATLSMRKSSTTLLKGLKKLSKEFGVDPLPIILNNGESEKIIENGHDKLRESTEEEKDVPPKKRNSEENHGITEKPSRKAPLPKEPTFSKLDWIDSSSEDELEGNQLTDDSNSNRRSNGSNGETSLDSPITKHIIRKSVTGEKKILNLGTNQEISNNNINGENNGENDPNRKKSRFDNFEELVHPPSNENKIDDKTNNNNNIIKIEENNNKNIPPKEEPNVVKKEEPKLVKAKTKFKFSITPNEELEAPRTNRFDNITMGNKKMVKKDLLAHEDVGDFSEIEIHSMLVRISKKLEKEPYFESFLPIKQKTFYQLAQTGVILCVLLDKLIPNSIFHSHRAIVWHPNREEEKYHNISLCLNTALNCGLDVEEITVESILEGDHEVQIGFLWQLIKGGIDHQLFCDTTLRPQLAKEFNIAIEEVFDWDTETLLFGWVNCHLKNSGYPDPLSSMADLRDGYIYLCLLQELTGENVEEAVSEPKTKKRVEKVISILTKKRVPEIVTVNSIMTGKERMNYHLLGFLYCVKKYLNSDFVTNTEQQQNIN